MLRRVALTNYLRTMAREQARSISFRAAGWALIGMGVAFASLFSSFALYLVLAEEVGGPQAALIIGAGGFALMGLPALVLLLRGRAAERRARAARLPALTTAASAVSVRSLPLGRLMMFAMVAGAGFEWFRRRR